MGARRCAGAASRCGHGHSMGVPRGNVATSARRGAMLWLVTWHCRVPLIAAQMTTSGAEDKSVLLEAAAAADTSACTDTLPSRFGCPVESWTAETDPFDGGELGNDYRVMTRGWLGVACTKPDYHHTMRRVVMLQLTSTSMGGELLSFFGRLGALLSLRLSDNRALRGNVADLAGATELRELYLNSCPLVVGEVGALAALVHLGEGYSQPGGGPPSPGQLQLVQSGVSGPVASLRALPGLGVDWNHFSSCSAFAAAPGCSGGGDGGPFYDRKPKVSGVSGCDDPRCTGLAFINATIVGHGASCSGCNEAAQYAPFTADTLASFLALLDTTWDLPGDFHFSGEMCPGDFVSPCGAAGTIDNAVEVAGTDSSVCCDVLTCAQFDCTGSRFDLATDATEVVCVGERCYAEECESPIEKSTAQTLLT